MRRMRLISASILALAILLVRPPAALTVHAAGRSPANHLPRAELVDINHADVGELKTLPGIQDALAAKIVKNRPYANKTQLFSKGVISAAIYKRLRALIIAKQ